MRAIIGRVGRAGESAAEDVMQRRERERTRTTRSSRILRQRAVEVERNHGRARRYVSSPAAPAGREPPCRELERPLRRQINPLHVVDRHQHRTLTGERR